MDFSSMHFFWCLCWVANFFAFWLLSRRPFLIIFCMLLMCILFFPLILYASPPVFSMDIFNLSTRKLVISVEFSKALYSSTFICLHVWCSVFNVFEMNQMMRTKASLDAVGNTHSIIFFSQTAVSMELNTWMEVKL